jgi:hypothetical protein
MDLSKLPKLSKTGESQPPPESAVPEIPQQPAYAQLNRAMMTSSIGLAEAWISIGLGLLLLFIFPRTISYLHSMNDPSWNSFATDPQGNSIPYGKSGYFWADLGVTVFAAALILEGIALVAIRKSAPLWIAFIVTVFAAVFNIGVIVHTEPLIGFPIFCGVGVVVLGYMALTQWRLISALRN